MGGTKREEERQTPVKDKKLTFVNDRKHKHILCGQHPSVIDMSSVILALKVLLILRTKDRHNVFH